MAANGTDLDPQGLGNALIAQPVHQFLQNIHLTFCQRTSGRDSQALGRLTALLFILFSAHIRSYPASAIRFLVIAQKKFHGYPEKPAQSQQHLILRRRQRRLIDSGQDPLRDACSL